MKRFLSVLTALCLMCSLSLPALAAGTPNWDGPLGKGAGPHLCKTGKDDILYYDMTGSVYRSADGVTCTELNRQWAEESRPYGAGLNGLAKKEFELLWTGSEYMMRQSLLDDPRTGTHQNCGDSPRNNMVTFLDEDFHIIGVRAFDAPVTAIGCENGGYSAEVNGEKVTFSRADWDPGDEGGSYYSGAIWYQGDGMDTPVEATHYLIREQPGNDGPFSLAVSTDGRSWIPMETKMTPDMMRLKETGGGAVVYYCPYTAEIWYCGRADGPFRADCAMEWQTADLGYNSAEGVGSPWADYTFRWTGDGYLMRQSVTGRGGMMGFGADEASPYNNRVILLDPEFRKVGEYDLGAPVDDVAYVDGMCYAKAGGIVYESADRTTWTASARTEFPGTRSDTDGALVYKVTDGQLLASRDGVYFLPLCPWTEEGIAVHRGTGGTVLSEIDSIGNETYVCHVVDWAETGAAWETAYPAPRCYVTLDGEKLSFDTAPITRNDRILVPLRGIAEVLDFTVTWDQASNRVLCERGETRIALEIGSPTAWVNGEERVQDVAPLAYQNRTYVPLRFLSEAFGLDVQWNAEEKTAVLTTVNAE